MIPAHLLRLNPFRETLQSQTFHWDVVFCPFFVTVYFFCRLPDPGSAVQSGGIETRNTFLCDVFFVDTFINLWFVSPGRCHVTGKFRHCRDLPDIWRRWDAQRRFPACQEGILNPAAFPPFEFGVAAESALRAWWRHQRGAQANKRVRFFLLFFFVLGRWRPTW